MVLKLESGKIHKSKSKLDMQARIFEGNKCDLKWYLDDWKYAENIWHPQNFPSLETGIPDAELDKSKFVNEYGSQILKNGDFSTIQAWWE